MTIHRNGILIRGEKAAAARVFAYLTAAETTTVGTGGTYYYIRGTFANSPIEGFVGVADPAIKYTNVTTLCFEIDWAATVSADDGGRTIHCAIKHNGVLVDGAVMGGYQKTADEPLTISGTAVVELEQSDTIQLVLTSSVDGDVVTVHHFTTTMREFC